jgi:hypothetical protein
VLRSLGNPALLNNLPAELSTFVGRATELKEILPLVDSLANASLRQTMRLR